MAMHKVPAAYLDLESAIARMKKLSEIIDKNPKMSVDQKFDLIHGLSSDIWYKLENYRNPN
jgi:hypothetical protein